MAPVTETGETGASDCARDMQRPLILVAFGGESYGQDSLFPEEARPSESPAGCFQKKFITKAAIGAGATAATVLGSGKASADDASSPQPIKVPAEFTLSTKVPPVKVEFPMSGAQVFARVCKEEGLAALFCCPGNYPFVNAIAQEGIPTYSGRHEGAMCHAADGFCRVTGEVAAASGTEGPGFTDMINAIATANAARSPVLVLASNMSIRNEDTEAGIQLGYQQPNTEGLKKYGKRLITPARVHEYGAYAFRQLRSGVPRPVHLDFPSEVTRASFKTAGDLEYFYDKTRYRTEAKPHPGPEGDQRGGRSAQTGPAADDRFKQRRLLQPRLGCAEEAG